MRYEAVSHVFLATPSLAGAVAAHERLGLRFGPETRPLDPALHHRAFAVGGPNNLVSVELVGVDPDVLPTTPLGTRLSAATFDNAGLFAVGLRVADLAGTLKTLGTRGLAPQSRGHLVEHGKKTAEVALLAEVDRAGFNLLLVQDTQTLKLRQAALSKAGLLAHGLPLKRLDHLATIARDLAAQTRFWVDVLGVPLAGEVTTPTLVIRQFRVGDAVLELLGPATPDSPLVARPPGPISMASWEVADLDAVVNEARAAGFTLSDPAPGALPRTRTATIPGDELGGLTMQLLQPVSDQ